MIPFVKIVVNIIRNEIVYRGQGMSIGVAGYLHNIMAYRPIYIAYILSRHH